MISFPLFSIVGGVLGTAALLMAVTTLLPLVEFDDWTSAIFVAAFSDLINWGLRLSEPALNAQGLGGWPLIAAYGALSIVTLAVGIAIVPGIKRDGGLIGVLITAILVRALGFAIAMVYLQLLTAGLKPS